MRRPTSVKPILFFSSFFLFASLAEVFVAAEVQSRARRFCAAKRTLDGFSAATVQSLSEAKRICLVRSQRRTAFPSIRTLMDTNSPVHFEVLYGALPP